jgi:hypothetical protein
VLNTSNIKTRAGTINFIFLFFIFFVFLITCPT